MNISEIISLINRHNTADEQSLLEKVTAICKAAEAKFTVRRSQSLYHTAYTFTVRKDGSKDNTMIALEA